MDGERKKCRKIEKKAKKFGKHRFFIVSLQRISGKDLAWYTDVRDGREMVASRSADWRY